MANIFFTADLHLDHKNIIGHAKRPFSSVEEMNEVLVNNWNSLVQKGDTVYIVGDFAWKNHAYWLNRLNGKKILIMGNHDNMNSVAKKQFTEVHDFGKEIKIDGQYISLSHYAMRTWNHARYGSWHLYGHSHGRMRENRTVGFHRSLSFDVGVDVWGFRPVPYDIVKKKMQKRLEYGEPTTYDYLRGIGNGLANSIWKYLNNPLHLFDAIRNEAVFDFYEAETEVVRNRRENLEVWPLTHPHPKGEQ